MAHPCLGTKEDGGCMHQSPPQHDPQEFVNGVRRMERHSDCTHEVAAALQHVCQGPLKAGDERVASRLKLSFIRSACARPPAFKFVHKSATTNCLVQLCPLARRCPERARARSGNSQDDLPREWRKISQRATAVGTLCQSSAQEETAACAAELLW
jgi:hypothetical protein